MAIEFDENNESTRDVMEVIMAKNKTGCLETINYYLKKILPDLKNIMDLIVKYKYLIID